MTGILEGKFITDSSITEDKLSNEIIEKLNDTIEIVQTTGSSTDTVMSQKAVTDALGAKANVSDIPTDYVTTASLSNYVPTSRKINGKALNSDITLTASEIGAASTSDLNNYLPKTGGALTGKLTMNQNTINLGAAAGYQFLQGTTEGTTLQSNTQLTLNTTNSANINLTTVGNGIATYNGSEIATKEDIPTDYAKTSDLDNYLPKTGGALTGALTGTNITLNGNISANSISMATGSISGSVFRPATNNSTILGSSAYNWSSVYANDYYEAGKKLSSKYLSLEGGTITGGLRISSTNKLQFADEARVMYTQGGNIHIENTYNTASAYGGVIISTVGGTGIQLNPSGSGKATYNTKEIATKEDIPTIVQTTGTSTASVMSQKAVTDALSVKANSSDIPTDYATTASLNNYVPTTRKVNGKPLNSDISLTASEIGAATTSDIPLVVQSTGTSTTSIMSQNAVCSMIFADPSTKYRIQIGSGASAGSSAVAIGYGSKASGSYAFSSGYNSNASAAYTIAIGFGATAPESSCVAIGYNSKANNSYSTTIGRDATTSGEQATALGYNSTASGNNSTALGSTSSAQSAGSIALGYDSQVLSSDIVTGDSNSYGVVSVGKTSSSTSRRRIINVRPGVNNNDAATVSQINSTRSSSLQLSEELLDLIELLISPNDSLTQSRTLYTENIDDNIYLNNSISSKITKLREYLKEEKQIIEEHNKQQELLNSQYNDESEL